MFNDLKSFIVTTAELTPVQIFNDVKSYLEKHKLSYQILENGHNSFRLATTSESGFWHILTKTGLTRTQWEISSENICTSKNESTQQTILKASVIYPRFFWRKLYVLSFCLIFLFAVLCTNFFLFTLLIFLLTRHLWNIYSTNNLLLSQFYLIKEKLHEPFVATLPLSHIEVFSKIQDYFKKQNLAFTIKELYHNSSQYIIATISDFFYILFGKSPASTEWNVISLTNTQTKIKVFYEYPKMFWFYVIWFIVFFLVVYFYLLAFVVDYYGDLTNYSRNSYAVIMVLGSFLVAIVPLAFLFIYFLFISRISRKNINLTKKFCALYCDAGKSVILKTGKSFPYLTLFIVTSIIIVLIVPSDIRIAITLFLLFTVIVPTILLSINSKFAIRFQIGIFGAITGIFLVTLFNFPLILGGFGSNIDEQRILEGMVESLSVPVKTCKSLLLTVIAFLGGIIFLFILRQVFRLISISSRLLDELKILKYPGEQSIYETSLSYSLNLFERSVIWFYWILCAIGTLLALYTSISVIFILYEFDSFPIISILYNYISFMHFAFSVLLDNVYSQNTIAILSDLFLFLFACTFVILGGGLILHRLLRFFKLRQLLKNGKTKEYDATIQAISAFFKIKSISISILPPDYIEGLVKTNNNCIAFNVLGIIQFNDQPEQLSAIIAHEIAHIKRRYTHQIRFYNILSEFTLMGKNFLLILSDFYAEEYEADKAAVNWLVHYYKYSPRKATDIMIELLETTRGVLQEEKLSKSKIRRMVDLYFFGKPESYFHPSINLRIEKLKQFKLYVSP